jgi:hypothetical protein
VSPAAKSCGFHGIDPEADEIAPRRVVMSPRVACKNCSSPKQKVHLRSNDEDRATRSFA